MNIYKKVLVTQIGFILGGVIAYKLLGYELEKVVSNHLVITIAYVYGFYHRNKMGN